jgi:hypothetical protein
MKPQDGLMTKTNAISYIGLQTGYGRPFIEKAIQRLQDAGRITPTVFPHTILYTRDDVELVIKVLKGEIE